MRRFLIACLSGLLSLPAAAQNFPNRPIKLIVPFAPGASSDATARALAHALEPRLGQSVVVENVPGGGGTTGVQNMGRSTPDGHTLSIAAAGAMVIIPLMPGAPANWNPEKDILPIARLVDVPLVVVAHPATGPKTLAEAFARSKAAPDGLTFGSTGTNSGMHLAMEFLSFKTGSKMVHVPYRGSAPAVMDAVSGQVPMVAVDLTAALPQIEAGKVTGLAIIGPKRVSFAPKIPSFGDLGYKDYDSTAFLGLFAPMGTPPAIVKTLNDHVGAVVATEDFRKRMHTVALEPSYLDSAGFSKFLVEDRARWRVMLKAIGKLQ